MTITEEIEYLEHLFSGHYASMFGIIEEGIEKSGVTIQPSNRDGDLETYVVYVRPEILKKWKENNEEV